MGAEDGFGTSYISLLINYFCASAEASNLSFFLRKINFQTFVLRF